MPVSMRLGPDWSHYDIENLSGSWGVGGRAYYLELNTFTWAPCGPRTAGPGTHSPMCPMKLQRFPGLGGPDSGPPGGPTPGAKSRSRPTALFFGGAPLRPFSMTPIFKGFLSLFGMGGRRLPSDGP